MGRFEVSVISAFVIYWIVLPLLDSAAEERDDSGCSAAVQTVTALKYKIIAIFSSLIVGVFGVCLPIIVLDLDGIFLEFVRSLREFAALVISCISILHILRDAEKSLWRYDPPWNDFEMASSVAAAAAFITMIESIALAFMKRSHEEENQILVHNKDASHSHNKKLLTQLLELELVVRSVILGISLGATPRVSTIKPLIAAITLHHSIEGIRLGRCISQAKFELKKSLLMAILFFLTTPLGIGIGIGLADIYKENSPTTLMLSGFLNAAASGILFYMSFVAKDTRRNSCSLSQIILDFIFVFSLVVL